MKISIDVGVCYAVDGDEYTKEHWVCASSVQLKQRKVPAVSLGLEFHRGVTAEEAREKATAAAQATLRELCKAVAEVSQ